jgi:hypothetical protein
VRDWSSGIDAEAAAGGGDERAPVSGGVALWLAMEAREVAAAQRRREEGEIAAWGVRISAGGGRVPFLKGSTGGGIGGGVGRHGRLVEEAGHEQGGSLPIGEQCLAGSGPKSVGAHDVRCARAAGRIEGEGRG